MEKINNHSCIDITDLSQEPIERAETIPSRWYTDPSILEFEQEAVFSKSWQLVAHESQLPEPGDIFLSEAAGNPVMLVRDKDMTLRAFYNVCKHRGGPLAIKKGTTSVLQCQYHGWTYLLDGSLRGVPQFNYVDLFDKKDFGLEQIQLKTWQELIFINLNPKSEVLENILKGVSNRIFPIDLSSFSFYKEESYLINCNWKVYVDNFLEGYHIPIVHPELAKLLDYRNYVTETADWYSLQYSPFKEGDNLYRTCDGKAFYYFIFPNIMLNILPGRLQTNIIRPVSVDRTEVVFTYYYEDIEAQKDQGIIDEDIKYSHDIQLEDIEICELVQRGLRSRAYNKGRFSVERESGVYHFQSLLKNVFKRELQASQN